MHEPKRSDLAVVAVKPTNKAGSTAAAELVEPRARAEGNADQQSTHRAQIRARVSQALERVRQAAKERKKERFTALLHHINLDLLMLSFYALRRNAAAGADGVTWRDYEADLERNLQDLHARVQRSAYRAQPSRRKYIAKPDGRQRPDIEASANPAVRMIESGPTPFRDRIRALILSRFEHRRTRQP